MPVPCNPMGLLYAEIDSAGSLRLAGDRVLFGKRSQARIETEWLVRQKVTRCRRIIAEVVHGYGGIIARTEGDRIFCQLPDAASAFEAACAMQQAIAPQAGGDTDMSAATVVTQMGVRIAIHHGALEVEGGILSGQQLQRLQALLHAAEPDQILTSQALVDRLPPALRALTVESEAVARDTDDNPLPTWQLHWKQARPRVRLAHLSGTSTSPPPAAYNPAAAATPAPGAEEGEDDLEATQMFARSPLQRPAAAGLVQRLAARRSDGEGGAGDAVGTPAGAAPAPPAAEAPLDAPVRGVDQADLDDVTLPGLTLRLRARGREVVLDRTQPSIVLRGGPRRGEHARIILRREGFVLENRHPSGTYVRDGAGDEQQCTDRVLLSGEGSISLGLRDFDDPSQRLEYSVS